MKLKISKFGGVVVFGGVLVFWRCGGLMISARAYRPPVPVSNLGMGPSHSGACGAADRTVNTLQIQ